jgi:sterol 3beta-glucosyltransferase
MRIGMQVWGSDGDIRPMLALGRGLIASGHEVSIVVTSVDDKDYGDLCHALGLNYLRVPPRLGVDIETLMAKTGSSDNNLVMLKTLLNELFFPFLNEMYKAATELCSESEAVIGHFSTYPLKVAALKARLPHATLTYWPGMVPSTQRVPEGLPDLGPWFARLAWKFVQIILDFLLKRRFKELYQREGLVLRHIIPDAWYSDTLNLIPASPMFWHTPSDWGTKHRVCGFFNMPEKAESWYMPPSMEAFLKAGSRPVYITLGSSQKLDPEGSMDLLVAACRYVGCRAMIQTASPRFSADTQEGDIYFTGPLPHNRVFQRCAAVVHHGGAGTAQSATRAGLPSVVVAFADEQVSWGNALRRMGVADKPLRYKKATPQKLAMAIRKVLHTPAMTTQAAKAAAALREEDGVKTAVEIIENWYKIEKNYVKADKKLALH